MAIGARLKGVTRFVAGAALLGALLVGCGGAGQPASVPGTVASASPAGTPAAATAATAVGLAGVPIAGATPGGPLPAIPQTIALSIRNGTLSPQRISAISDTLVILSVTGDGTPHTLSIDRLVDAQPVGSTSGVAIPFSADGEPGERAIKLDGKNAGVFELQDAAGSTDDPNKQDAPQ